jgi:small GTP-binding protein
VRILNEQQESLLKNERQLLTDLRLAMVQFGADPSDSDTLGKSLEQLDELFLMVVVGEFNAGKSAFINALLGQRLLKEGVTPTTTEINTIRYGLTEDRHALDEKHHVITLPVDLLSEISIVDTPGTNAVIRSHEAITTDFIPRADLVLFVTSTDRPFTESERAFLEGIRDWGKKVVIIVNKIDLLENPDELQEVMRFIAENALMLLGITPEIFPVSAKLAQRAKQGEPDLWSPSRFEPLEVYIIDTLDEISRVRLKLLNPLGIGMYLVGNYLDLVADRLNLLKDDIEMLADVDAQLGLYKEDMQRDFQFRMADIEKILFEMEQRGQDYFDETFRLARVFDLLNKQRVQQAFNDQVVANVPQQIEQKVNELIDWLVESDLRQWKAVNDYLAERKRAHQGRIVGSANAGFVYDRERLMDAVGREAQRVVDTYNKDFEAQTIADNARAAVAASAAIEVGAIGLGTLVTILATTMAADVTGILLASLLAVVGLFVIPAQRRKAKAELRQKVAGLREQLTQTLRSQFGREIERSLERINDAIAPYARFVRAERSKLKDAQGGFQRIKNNLYLLKIAIEELK